MKVPAQTARELADAAVGADFRDFPFPLRLDVVENRHTGQETRWTSIHELVVKDDDGRLWCAHYERGLTEYQDTRPFDRESYGAWVEFWEVRRKVVETYEYEKL